MFEILEQVTKKFVAIRELIDAKEHPRSYRVLHFISWRLILEDERTYEEIANDFIENVDFWEWCNKNVPKHKQKNLSVLKDVFNAMDDEDKV